MSEQIDHLYQEVYTLHRVTGPVARHCVHWLLNMFFLSFFHFHQNIEDNVRLSVGEELFPAFWFLLSLFFYYVSNLSCRANDIKWSIVWEETHDFFSLLSITFIYLLNNIECGKKVKKHASAPKEPKKVKNTKKKMKVGTRQLWLTPLSEWNYALLTLGHWRVDRHLGWCPSACFGHNFQGNQNIFFSLFLPFPTSHVSPPPHLSKFHFFLLLFPHYSTLNSIENHS